jgi:uncharacterized protein YcbK (DUF882 family)
MSNKLLSAGAVFSLIKTKDYAELLQQNVSENFKWKEVFIGIQPNEWGQVTLDMLKNAIRMAQYMDKVRDYFGKPIRVTSWLRVPKHNARVGGASSSKHLLGIAVDFVVQGVPFNQAQMARLNKFHTGGLARADFNKDGWADFVHIDLGAERTWTY